MGRVRERDDTRLERVFSVVKIPLLAALLTTQLVRCGGDTTPTAARHSDSGETIPPRLQYGMYLSSWTYNGDEFNATIVIQNGSNVGLMVSVDLSEVQQYDDVVDVGVLNQPDQTFLPYTKSLTLNEFRPDAPSGKATREIPVQWYTMFTVTGRLTGLYESPPTALRIRGLCISDPASAVKSCLPMKVIMVE